MHVLCVLLVTTLWGNVFANDTPCEYSVRIDSGIVCGVLKKASNGNNFVSFLGIPYAKPPIGKLRFKPPQKPEPFHGVFYATKPSLVCPQGRSDTIPDADPNSMSEDCLNINVHVPLSFLPEHGESCVPLANVFVYFHGGSFDYGSGNTDIYGPEYLMSKGIMLVTANYRLNVFGFLSLNNKYVPGNAGLRDAVFAVEWVKRNILNFGGNPHEVTVGGQSAGGSIAQFLAISPSLKEKKMMKRLIALSGNVYSNFYSPSKKAAKFYSDIFLRGMNISSCESSETIHQILIDASMEQILKANDYVKNVTGDSLTFAPVIESTFNGLTPIVPEDPENLVKAGYGKQYRSLFSFTNNEYQLYKKSLKATDFVDTLVSEPTLTVPLNLLYASNDRAVPTLVKEISSEYFNRTWPSLDSYLDLCTDSQYKYPVMRLAAQRVAVESALTFVYEFGYRGENSLLKILVHDDWPGAAHTEDLMYFFRMNVALGPMVQDELAEDDPDSRMRNWMTTFIANFVKTGSPTSDPKDWPSVGVQFRHQSIQTSKYDPIPATPYLADKKRFYDKLYKIGRGDDK